MTNEDIIKELTLMRKNFDPNSVYGSYCIDCLDAAIEALKEQSKHDQNTSSKQQDLDTLGIKTEETCADAISRRAAIDVILSDKIDDASLEIMTALGEGRFALTLNDACDRHIRDIEKLPSAQPEQHWIPCSERLPEKSGQYYVSGGGKVWICKFLTIPNFAGGWCNNVSNPAVQAWTPLPEEPYKGES